MAVPAQGRAARRVDIAHLRVVARVPDSGRRLLRRRTPDRDMARNGGVPLVHGALHGGELYGGHRLEPVAEKPQATLQNPMAFRHRRRGAVRLGVHSAHRRHPLGGHASHRTDKDSRRQFAHGDKSRIARNLLHIPLFQLEVHRGVQATGNPDDIPRKTGGEQRRHTRVSVRCQFTPSPLSGVSAVCSAHGSATWQSGEGNAAPSARAGATGVQASSLL